MAKTGPFIRPQIGGIVAKKLGEKKQQERYFGSMASFIEGILVKYCEGLLVEAEDAGGLVRAVRVKQAGKDEQRKAG